MIIISINVNCFVLPLGWQMGRCQTHPHNLKQKQLTRLDARPEVIKQFATPTSYGIWLIRKPFQHAICISESSRSLSPSLSLFLTSRSCFVLKHRKKFKLKFNFIFQFSFSIFIFNLSSQLLYATFNALQLHSIWLCAVLAAFSCFFGIAFFALRLI